MSLKTLTALTASAAFVLTVNVSSLAAAELKVSGAAAVAGGVVMPNKAAIEQESGLTLTVTANGDGNGLKDLFAGKSDVAMVAAPLKMTEDVLNKASPGSISTAGFEVAPIGAVTIRFIAWKDVGGADPPGFGTRSNVVASLLGGSETTDKARTMQALVQVAQVVGQAPNAIGYGNAATIKDGVAVIPGRLFN